MPAYAGASLIPDMVPSVVGGVVSNQTVAQMTTTYGAGNIKTPTKDFSLNVNGHTVGYRKGVPVVTNAALNALFTLHNCPVS
ncbi:hypothetical protein [Cupriavidus basilensis]|uniref:hypothetical protein n=1 Tax=Cupriavidus basilensis TaxID=68895 RepID=UPI0039F6E511